MDRLPVNLAVIPVAGLGTRLLPLTKAQPKEMLPVGRKPVVQYIVEELGRAGIEQALFITGQGKDAIENHFDENAALIEILRRTGKEQLLESLEFERAQMNYFFTRQRRLLGLGHAVGCARAFVGDQAFVVALGDAIIGLNGQSDIVSRMQDCFATHPCEAVIAFEEVAANEVQHYGIARVGSGAECFEVLDLMEKPAPAEAPGRMAVAARYIFTPAIFDALNQVTAGKGGEIQLTDAICWLIHRGHRVYGVRLRPEEQRYDIGNFETYFRAFVEFALADQHYGDVVKSYLHQLLGEGG